MGRYVSIVSRSNGNLHSGILHQNLAARITHFRPQVFNCSTSRLKPPAPSSTRKEVRLRILRDFHPPETVCSASHILRLSPDPQVTPEVLQQPHVYWVSFHSQFTRQMTRFSKVPRPVYWSAGSLIQWFRPSIQALTM